LAKRLLSWSALPVLANFACLEFFVLVQRVVVLSVRPLGCCDVFVSFARLFKFCCLCEAKTPQ
jgi:hypothetical protein